MWVNDDLLDYETAYGDGDDDVDDDGGNFPDNSPHSFMTSVVAYQADVDEPSLAVLDTWSSRTMNGSLWAESFSTALAERRLQGIARQVSCSMLGVGGTVQANVDMRWPVGGTVQANVDMRWPVGTFENDGVINALQVEGSCPFLFSREAMSALNFAVRPKTKTPDSLQLGVFGEALCITGTGHLAISLLRFSRAWPAKAFGTEHHAQVIAPPEDGPPAETWASTWHVAALPPTRSSRRARPRDRSISSSTTPCSAASSEDDTHLPNTRPLLCVGRSPSARTSRSSSTRTSSTSAVRTAACSATTTPSPVYRT